MLVDTMIPEAFEEAHDFTGLITVIGFLSAFVLSRARVGVIETMPHGQRNLRCGPNATLSIPQLFRALGSQRSVLTTAPYQREL